MREDILGASPSPRRIDPIFRVVNDKTKTSLWSLFYPDVPLKTLSLDMGPPAPLFNQGGLLDRVSDYGKKVWG
jgi:hypothetical protein